MHLDPKAKPVQNHRSRDWVILSTFTNLYKFLFTVNDTLDEIFDESADEEECQDIVNQVLDEIGIEITGKVRRFLFVCTVLATAPAAAFSRWQDSGCACDYCRPFFRFMRCRITLSDCSRCVFPWAKM